MKRNNFYRTLLLMAFCGMAFVGCEKDDASGERDGRVDMSIVPVSPEDNQICYTATCQLDGIDFFAEATDHLYNSETGCGCVTFGSPVTEIREQAFWDNQDITTITLPATVTTIGKEAFAGCSSLRSATMPGVVTIGQNAFYACQLAEIDLPKVQTLDNGAFTYCPLTKIDLPEVRTVGNWVFNSPELKYVILGRYIEKLGDEAFKSESDKGIESVMCYNDRCPSCDGNPFVGSRHPKLHVLLGSKEAYSEWVTNCWVSEIIDDLVLPTK